MNDKPVENEVRMDWQNLVTEPVELSPSEFRRKSQLLGKTIWWRNLGEYAGALVVLSSFSYYFFKFDTVLIRLGCVLTIAGTLYTVYQLHRRGSAGIVPLQALPDTCIDFHRKQLEQQRDLLLSVWSWYLLPFIPGLVLFLLGIAAAKAKAQPAHVVVAALTFCLSVSFCGIVFFLIWRLNQSAARKLQLQIDTLVAIGEDAK